MLLILPSSPNSPTTKKSSNSSFCKRINKAIAKSKCDPFFGMPEGLRLIVIFLAGKAKSQLKSVALMRSTLSLIAVLASPTMLKFGKPLVKVDSTSIMSKPS